MKKTLTFLLLFVGFTAFAQSISFPPLDTNYRAQELRIASTLKSDILFEGAKSTVWTGSAYAPAKTWNDFTGLVPLGTGNDSCLLIVNHEMRNGYFGVKDPILGDGGGMTVFRVNKDANGRWKNVPYKGQNYWWVDFKNIRGTYTNCAGVTLAQPGLFMTAEEVTPASNTDLFGAFSDTTDYTIPSGPYKGRPIKAFQNYGWMITVDAPNAKALYKSYAMGRSSYEGGWALPDGKTVYLGTDATPAPLLRFVADTVGRFEYGQLQAYKQGANGVGGSWFDIPRDWDSVANVATVAYRRGATMFTRLEWVVANGNKLYLAETGNDAANYKSSALIGGVPSWHFQRSDTLGGQVRDSIYADFHGRVLELDLTTNNLRPFVEGGRGPKFALSSPDGLSLHTIEGKTYLLIVEDLNGTSQGRSGSSGRSICEAFFLDLSIQNPTLDDLRPFVAGPADAELTGSVSTPDGKTIFINIQHPYNNAATGPASSTNIPPYTNDMTVALTGFSTTTPTKELKISDDFSVYPNPATDVINFNKTTDVSLYNVSGQQIRVQRNVNQINVSNLNPGMYFLQNINGAVVKLIKQ